MILGFKTKFKGGALTYFERKILNGSKKHTIREDKTDRWKAGMFIQFATGVRTKQYEQFKESQCLSTQRIEIIRKNDYLEETVVKIDGRELSQDEVQQLAWNDGFQNLIDFWFFFADGFEGKIIHWTDLKY